MIGEMELLLKPMLTKKKKRNNKFAALARVSILVKYHQNYYVNKLSQEVLEISFTWVSTDSQNEPAKLFLAERERILAFLQQQQKR